MEKILTQERLRELLHYDPNTGIFVWLKTRSTKHILGCTAGSKDTNGYQIIKINSLQYKAHRLAFLYMKGYHPEYEVDHIDRDPSNNKWSNLRHVTHQCNMQNKSKYSNNKSGVTGVYWCKRSKKWCASVKVKGRGLHLGYFLILMDAVIARWKGEVKYGYQTCNTTSSAYQYLKKEGMIE